MSTECKQTTFEFHGLLRRKVKARFDGGTITSDAGVLLLREVEKRSGLIDGLARCFSDHRDQRLIEHTVKELLGQRVYGLCLGYEDLNDHDQLRTDPMLAVAVNKADPLGTNRRQAGDRGKALAGKSTLNRKVRALGIGDRDQVHPHAGHVYGARRCIAPRRYAASLRCVEITAYCHRKNQRNEPNSSSHASEYSAESKPPTAFCLARNLRTGVV